jgi:hypothetical protein
MLYITTALSAEARPLIDYYKLTRVYSLPYTLFENEKVKLIITGIGIENAMMATSALLGYLPPKNGDIFLNVGICAAPKEFAIGEGILAHKLTHKQSSYYPDILFEHNFHECELLCVDTPAQNILHAPTDMESYGIYKAASRFFATHAMLFFKVVSDHFEPSHINKEMATELISKQQLSLENLIRAAQFVSKQNQIFSRDEKKLAEQISELLTKSQEDAFYDACYYYKLHFQKNLHQSGITLPLTKLTKQGRNEYYEKLIKTLTL